MADNYLQTSWQTGALDYSMTYYWRVDERESGGNIVTGDVWNFTTMQGPQACLPGDLDGDCFVGLQDLLLFAEQWVNTGQIYFIASSVNLPQAEDADPLHSCGSGLF
jgi:hypothetical protein